MSSFIPTHVRLEPPPPPDYLAGAVLQGLSRPIGSSKVSWGVLKTLVLGTISFGMLPILAWVKGFHDFAVAEQQQFLHLSQWLGTNSQHPLTPRLESEARNLTPRIWLSILPVLLIFATAGWMGYVIHQSGREPINALLASTYGFEKSHVLDIRVIQFARAQTLFAVWFWGLTLAAVAHWLQVQLHAHDVKRLVSKFSQIVQAEGVNRARADSLGTTLRPLWLAMGVVLFLFQAPWGLPLALAGAAQRRYTTWTSRNTRGEVAQRLRSMLLNRRPDIAVPVSIYLRDRCVEVKCQADMPRGAAFCPRCGRRQKASVHQVA